MTLRRRAFDLHEPGHSKYRRLDVRWQNAAWLRPFSSQCFCPQHATLKTHPASNRVAKRRAFGVHAVSDVHVGKRTGRRLFRSIGVHLLRALFKAARCGLQRSGCALLFRFVVHVFDHPFGDFCCVFCVSAAVFSGELHAVGRACRQGFSPRSQRMAFTTTSAA